MATELSVKSKLARQKLKTNLTLLNNETVRLAQKLIDRKKGLPSGEKEEVPQNLIRRMFSFIRRNR